MIRALYTASSGMKAMQFNVDTISNNLANVNTYAYKKERAEFEDLLYVTMERAYILENQGRPVNLQVGHGTVIRSVARDFTAGSLIQTENNLDFAIIGDGFFSVLHPSQNIYYTRDGSFKLSVTDEGTMLTTARGYPVLDEIGEPIYFDYPIDQIIINERGEISYKDEDGLIVPTGQRIGIFKFNNPQGLEAVGGNLYAENTASGFAVPDDEMGEPSTIRQGYLEASNVQVVEEMVNLITAQRAYELNSKAITTADEMMSIANNLKR
ncbi:flagellar basal-body rod protein FlgG [Thermoclostridium stercorarium subsp. stercorarium DSM 8532]|jgi:flagellar basal-body rod protein FlgG|uniref:Flagellar basal-body rod protein FlgG n=3 Tax=Thermoclostridium stercorarium TaxID=1510 RepID=L7VKF2_THES1|nr:flagellar basal-body rod protein FlgG [Thermoclostridium stercorarium]AGC67119.1 flagellar basal-body rod protein FlgG [Thermoclostridium stercorarium subsp. stercorarium DSM 8532]AGI38199.1 FlgG [Thermoclostridium stercorarium subsp. stercorarium DSM 8532]ANW97604.1 flagellar basal-body rod protein FlgG [Thermoclostridium stercorarium subsp. thermolacticum DSM 2910]ANX00164.1 flagellar basal-body rod protein FlgG [Thermoclostridium stercorarium subsp. leptospartum DSM 9219]UZQ85719.1 flage